MATTHKSRLEQRVPLDHLLDKEDRPSRGRRLANTALAGVLSAAGVVGVGVAIENLSGNQEVTNQQKRVEILKQKHPILNRLITLGRGSTLRATPEHLDGTPNDGLPNNVVSKVLDGQLTISSPVLVEGKDGKTYLMFNKPGSQTSPDVEEQASHTVFADFSRLYDQKRTTPTDLTPAQAMSSPTQFQYEGTTGFTISGEGASQITDPMVSFSVPDTRG